MTRALAAVVLLLAVALVTGPLAIHLRERGDPSPPKDVAGRMIDVARHRVHVVEQGAGMPLLLVHGFGASTFDYEEFVLAKLAESHRVIAVDLYGFGWSERNGAFAYDWTLWADQLAGVLDSLGIERASVMGHSMGGGVAAVFASRHPTRVERLVLADALYPLDESEIPPLFKLLRAPVAGELALGLAPDLSPPGMSDRYRARTRAFTSVPGTRRAWLRYLRDPRRRTELAASFAGIAARTLVLHGTADGNVPYAAMQRTVPEIRSARVVTLEGGGHFLLRDAPDAVTLEVTKFLAEPR